MPSNDEASTHAEHGSEGVLDVGQLVGGKPGNPPAEPASIHGAELVEQDSRPLPPLEDLGSPQCRCGFLVESNGQVHRPSVLG